jgi:hypothetical protein
MGQVSYNHELVAAMRSYEMVASQHQIIMRAEESPLLGTITRQRVVRLRLSMRCSDLLSV